MSAMVGAAARPLFVVLGLLSLGLGLLGALLPIVPTMPFILLAAFFLGRSSPALHRWLLGNRLFGPVIRRWEEGGRISRPTKWMAALTLTAVLVYHLWAGTLPRWGQGLLAAVIGAVLAFIWSRPEDPPQP